MKSKQLFNEGDSVILWLQSSNYWGGCCRFETVGRVNKRWAYVAGRRFSQNTGKQISGSIYEIEHVTDESREAAQHARPLTP